MEAPQQNYRRTTIVPVAQEQNIPEPMHIEANPPPQQSIWQNDFVKTFMVLLVVAAGYLIVHLGISIAQMIHHHHHPHTHQNWCTRTVVVSADGTEHYTSVSEALGSSPNMSSGKFCILIKRGRYTENVVVGSMKTNIVLIGEGTDQTILTAKNKVTLEVLGPGFMATNLTVENDGVALNSFSDEAVFYNCKIMGNHSTLCAGHAKQFYRDCQIHGSHSIITGAARAYFQNCTISVDQTTRRDSSVIASQGRKSKFSWSDSGFVFDLCRMGSTQGSTSPHIYLGCPGGNYSSLVVMRSFISGMIHPKGWIMCDGPQPGDYLIGEFDNNGPGANTSDRTRLKGFHLLTESEASRFRLEHFFSDNIDWISDTGVPYLSD